jgi:hypothetical protein
MPVTRRNVLSQLATQTDAERQETTTTAALAAALAVDEDEIERHLDGLLACELARRDADDSIRVTVTGEELLDLDTDELVIVEPQTEGVEPQTERSDR